jgi:hypothetical protein
MCNISDIVLEGVRNQAGIADLNFGIRMQRNSVFRHLKEIMQ